MSAKGAKGEKQGAKGAKGGRKDRQKVEKNYVPAAPKLKTLKGLKVSEGQKAILKCELLSGGRETKITWYLNDAEISSNKNRKIKMNKRGTTSELRIMKVTNSDVGIYRCKASNSLGEDEQNSTLSLNKAVTSTTPSAKTSSHMSPCSEEEKSYCVNGGKCFTLNIAPTSIRRLCKCLSGFIGIRCETNDPVRVSNPEQAEELYQKRVLTITGICIALLVVGIMCVAAYCKTKKQRQKLRDHLRLSIRQRSTMADIANSSEYSQNVHMPPQSLQLVNQSTSKNLDSINHDIEKKLETSFSMSQYTSATPTAVTHSFSQSFTDKKMESAVLDSRATSGVSLLQSSRNGTPSRGRLNATGGGIRDVSAYTKKSRETSDSYRESPYSERYLSTVTTPTRLSPVKLLSPATPSSPPSEMSEALPSLATSVPSMAMSPSGEEERPLLFMTPPPLREKPDPIRAKQLRNSAHYNHGLDELSPPPSPLHIYEDEQPQSTQEGKHVTPTSAPPSPTAVPNSQRTKAGVQNIQETQKACSSGSSESSSSESETEEDRLSEDTPFLIQNPGALGLAVLSLEVADSSRTNAALHLSPQDDLQSRLAGVMVKQDPIAV